MIHKSDALAYDQGTQQTPLEDLKKSALEHYEEASTAIHHWNSSIPQAINFYFDEQKKKNLFSFKLLGFEFSLKRLNHEKFFN